MARVFGREREQDGMRDLVAAAADGLAVLQIEGEPGIGKTTLWEAGVAAAVEREQRVLSSRPAQAEATLTFAALADLLVPLDRAVLRALPDPQRHALEVALLRASPGHAPPDPRAVATALLSLLERVAARDPVLVAVDDVQWIDSASAAALAFAIRRLGSESPVGVLTTARVESGRAPDPRGLEHLRPAGRPPLRLGPLELAALHDLLDARLGVGFSRPVLQRIEQESGGNPLFAIELGRALRDSGLRPGPGEPLPLDHGFRELLEARSARLRPATRDGLLAVALMAHPSDELVERVVGQAGELDA